MNRKALVLLLVIGFVPSCKVRFEADKASDTSRGAEVAGYFTAEEPARPPARSASGAISSPKEGATLVNDVEQLTAHIDNLPPGTQVFVVVSDRFNTFLQWPPATPVRADIVEFENLRLATPGAWRVSIAVATEDAARKLHASAHRQEWRLNTLPAGLTILDTVRVKRSRP